MPFSLNQLEQVTELISLPETYLKIHNLMDDSKSEVDDFARVVNLDPNLTARLLKAANSAFFGFTGEISSVPRAIKMMGIQQLHFMVLSISAMTAVSTLEFPDDIVKLKTFWRCSLLSGALSQLLGQQLGAPAFERFFTTGLLHEIGHLVLYACFPQQAREANKLAIDSNIHIHQAEQQILGCHYGNIGARLMQHWNLPAFFQTLTNFQPTPAQATEKRLETSILHISHAFAHQHHIALHNAPVVAVDPVAWEITQLSPEEIDQPLAAALLLSRDLEQTILG
ncbi:MAG: HDOD domain-containing protein [Gammaproteobacteria bacterium]|nr:HDOD domain-containing protein [Gammaproteobacteria bacterium]